MVLPVHLGAKLAEFIIITDKEVPKALVSEAKRNVAESGAEFQKITAPSVAASTAVVSKTSKGVHDVHVFKVVPGEDGNFSVKLLKTGDNGKMAVTNADAELKDWAMGQIRDMAHTANAHILNGKPLKFLVRDHGVERIVTDLSDRPAGAMARVMRAYQAGMTAVSANTGTFKIIAPKDGVRYTILANRKTLEAMNWSFVMPELGK